MTNLDVRGLVQVTALAETARTFEWGAHRVHIDDSGSGQPVVLVHSSGFSGRQWRTLAARLVGKELRAVAPDLLGSGRSMSWPGREPFAFYDDVELLGSLLDDIDRPVHLVGHSYGGLIALRAALQSPSRVRSLSLYDPVVYGALDEDRDPDALADLARLHFAEETPENLQSWLEELVDYWNGPGSWAQLGTTTRNALERVGWVLHEGARSVAEDRTPASAYEDLNAPTLLLRGGASPLAARRVVDRLAEAMPNARPETIEGAGHMGPLTHADRVNDVILAHISAA
jgi:pimeloyl-ACP methyl ester carboxylesterase